MIAANLWVSPARKSGRMDAREHVQVLESHGFEGCAHGQKGKRQVLFASAEHLDALGVERGRVRENITVEGADVDEWPIGQRVRVGGEAEFEITMVCDPCERMEAIRPGLRKELEGKRGMLARVVCGGEVAAGDPIRLL